MNNSTHLVKAALDRTADFRFLHARAKLTRLGFASSCIFIVALVHGFGADGVAARVGVLQTTPGHAKELKAAGVTLAVVGLSWNRFEPAQGQTDAGYIANLKRDFAIFRAADLDVILDLGLQYPPDWLFKTPDSRYRNQFGDDFADFSPGMNIANAIFNRKVRQFEAAYLQRVFEELGTAFYAVRLGGGWFGELNYPPHKFKGRDNCYWAFDEIAQGKRDGLPDEMKSCPVPGWIPGTAPRDPGSARLFTEWYLDSLRNYHDWQIATTRRWFSGRLMMLYPSWGIRPGQLEGAVDGGLSGNTSVEKNGEIQRGCDFARFVAGIRDFRVMLHCTWADANPAFGNDDGTDPAGWSPLHYLASLGQKHSPPLAISAENTGGGGERVVRLCAERVHRYQVGVFLWAFEKDLFDGTSPELDDLKLISK